MNLFTGILKFIALEAISLLAWVLGAKERNRVRASWALYFGVTSYGGVDDGFLSELSRLIDEDPSIVDGVAAHIKGTGPEATAQRETLAIFAKRKL